MKKKFKVNKMLICALFLSAATWMAVASSEMDPMPKKVETSPGKVIANQTSSNVIIVDVDENGNETYYAGRTTVAKEAIENDGAMAEKAIAEIVTDKNLITKPETKSNDEMDQANSIPQWFYFGIGFNFAPSWYGYTYTYCPPAPYYYCRPVPYYRPVWHHYPHHRHHYRFYWC